MCRFSAISIIACITSTQMLLADSHTEVGFELLAESTCDQPMRLAIKYLPPNGTWTDDQWWDLPAGQSTYLASNGVRLKHQIQKSYLYVYAETITGYGYFTTTPIPEDHTLIRLSRNKYVVSKPASGKINGDAYHFLVHCDDK